MKKITFLFVLLLVFGYSAQAQYSFPSIAGPTNVASGTPVTLNINDVANVASAPASSTGSYSSFEVTADWAAGGGNPWSNEADLTLNTTGGNSVVIDPATSGAGANGNATQLVFTGDFVTPYDPSTDGFIDIVLNQSFGGSNADWSNIVVTIFESPTCLEPSGMDTANNIGTAVDLNWTANSGETAWNIQWNADADFTPGNGEETGATSASGTPTTNISGLVLDTNYFVYYQADCGGGDTSAWVGPFTFRTGYCESVPSSNDGDGITQIIAGSTTLTSAGDVTYEDFTGTTVNLSQSILATVLIDFATGFTYNTNIWIDFNNDFDFDDAGELVFQGESTNANPTTLDASFVMPSVPLGTYRMRIGTADSGQATPNPCYNGSWGVTADLTINVTDPPACIPPTFLQAQNITDTSAQIDWTANNGELNWEIVVQPAGTGVPTGAGTATTDNPYSAMALNPSSAYEVYVRADCGTGFSDWAGPLNFTTDNTPPPPPNGVTCSSGASSFLFVEDFETDPAAGWTGTTFSGNNGDWQITAGDGNSGGTGPFASFNGGMHLEYEASGNSSDIASAITPAIDLAAAVDGAELSFYMHAFGEDMGTLNVGIATDPAGPFTNLYTWIGNYQAADTDDWVPIGINLDAYLGQVVYIEFSYGGAGSGFEGDMSIDFVRVESCGDFCIAPNPVNITNVQGTTADLDWVANNGESAWEYVVQPAGTGEPTGAGTATTTNSINLTGLDYSTDYEVYVRADCGSGFSVWAGPINFTTTVQFDYTVDCALGPVNTDFCYFDDIDDDPSVATFTYTSSNGLPLNLTFNQGQLESCCDELVVIDSDGTELYNATIADVTGLTFQSSGDTISWYINSDFSVNCGSSGFTPINATVACATCINPDANYLVVDDCDNGDQFLIDVDVTSMGDATTLNITDNQGSTPVAVTTTGITQFGPYPFGVDIIITIENADDANCIINSPAIQQLACPPDNDNPCTATVATVNDDDTCDILNPGTLIAASDSGVPNGSCTGNPNDDVWYEFTALAETQIISLSNIQGGTFDIDLGLYEGTCDNLVELECTNNDSFVTPILTIGNTYYIRVFSGGSDDATSTFDLCIKEAPTNISCENASNFCGDGGALYGSNTIGIPDDTDVACLGSVPNPSWNIIQVSESGPIEIQIVQNTEFDDAGNPIGDGLDVDFVLWGPFDTDTDYCALDLFVDCPTCPFSNVPDTGFYPFGNIIDCSYSAAAVENLSIDNALAGEIYLLLVTNFSNDPGIIQIEQTNADDPTSGSLTAEIEADLGEDQDLCGFPDYTITVDSPFADTYEWFKNGILMDGETEDTLVVTESDTYTVIVYNEQCDTSAQDSITVNFFQDANTNAVDDIITCDDLSGDDIEDFDLEIQTAGILGTQDPNAFVVTYHASLADAQSAASPLTSPYTNTSNPQTIYVRVEDVNAVGSNSGCFATTSFQIEVSGVTPTVTSVDFAVCDDASQDGVELFNLDSHSDLILNGQDPTLYTVTYYLNETDALDGNNAITSPYENTSSPQPIFVRVENNDAFDCYAVGQFNLIVDDVPATSFDADFDYEVCPNATVPIEIEAIPENYNASDVSIVWYRDGEVITGETSLTLPVLLEGDYMIEVTNADGCIGTASVTIIELETCVIPEGISPNGDGFNDTFDLSSYDVQSLEIYNRNGVLVYSKTNYTNEWVGQTDGGDQLPVGTYFYVMKYQQGQQRAAWVYLNY